MCNMVIVGTRNRKAEQRKWHDSWLSYVNAFAIYNIAHNFEKYIISIISCYRSDNASYFYCKFVSMYNLWLMKE